jgi:predicted PurR-regulated permease PerM
MSNLVLLSENPSFIAVATGVSLLLLFIGFVGFHLLKKISRQEADLKKIRVDGGNALDGILKLSNSWNEHIKDFESRHNRMIAMVEQVRFEQELLTKTVGSDHKLSKAIEFARAGSSVDDIVKRAGISVDEAKAVARFHGPNDSD